jgi:iron complex outermembrane receptor protein
VGRHGFQGKLSGTVTRDPGFDYYFKEFDGPETGFGWARGLDRERTWSLHTHLKRYGWSLAGLVSSRAKVVPTASWGSVFNDDKLETADLVGFLDVKYDRQIAPTTHLSGRVTYDWYSYNGVWPSEVDGEFSVVEDPHRSRVLGGEIVVSAQALAGSYAVAGVSLKRVLSARIRAYQAFPEYYSYVNVDTTEQVMSAFAQDEMPLGTWPLTAVLGIRYDRYSDFGDALNPRLGIVAKSNLGATKLLYGKSFRAPTLYERYYDDTEGECTEGTIKANPDLGAEHADTYEVVHDADLGGRAHASVSAFYYRLVDLTDERGLEGGCLTSVNAGTYRSKGVEAEIRGVGAGGLTWSASYSLTNVRNEDTGERPAASPDNLATLRVAMPFAQARATFGITLKYIGGRLTRAGAELDPAVLANATLHFGEFAPGLTASISARNLFNAEHSEPGGPEHLQETLPQDQRSVLVRLGWEL